MTLVPNAFRAGRLMLEEIARHAEAGRARS